MRALTAAKKLGDTSYETYLNETVFELENVFFTRGEAARDLGPSLIALGRLHATCKRLGIRHSRDLFNTSMITLAETPGVGLRQLEMACCVLDAAGHDVDRWIPVRGKRGTSAAYTKKRATKRKAGKRTYRKTAA